jgi:fructose-1,6-bisphosphatase I
MFGGQVRVEAIILYAIYLLIGPTTICSFTSLLPQFEQHSYVRFLDAPCQHHVEARLGFRSALAMATSESKVDHEYYSTSAPFPQRQQFPSVGGGVMAPGAQQKVTLTRFFQQMVEEQPEVSVSIQLCIVFFNFFMSQFHHFFVGSFVLLKNLGYNPGKLREVESLVLAVNMACKSISNLVTRSPSPVGQEYGGGHGDSKSREGLRVEAGASAQFNSMKKLDELSTNVLRNALRFTGKFTTVKPAKDIQRRQQDIERRQQSQTQRTDRPRATDEKENPAQHQPGVLIASALDGKYVAFFDPLDGSNNADAAICTGTIFGVFKKKDLVQNGDGIKLSSGSSEGGDKSEDEMETSLINSILQSGKNLRAAGYCLYSSSTILVCTIGKGVHMFTLDPTLNEFVLTNPDVRIPQRGNIYSCNESNSDGWSENMQRYIRSLRTGANESGMKYTSRYVGSLAADIHRTMIYGGIFSYARDTLYHPDGNLQLLYKSAPLAYLIKQAGGKNSNGEGQEVLDITPKSIHERQPCFIGSPDDIDEMKKYLEKGL